MWEAGSWGIVGERRRVYQGSTRDGILWHNEMRVKSHWKISNRLIVIRIALLLIRPSVKYMGYLLQIRRACFHPAKQSSAHMLEGLLIKRKKRNV